MKIDKKHTKVISRIFSDLGWISLNFIEYFIEFLPISCFLWLWQAGAGKPDKRMFQLCEAGRFLAAFWAPFEDLRRSDLRGQIWLLSRGVGQEHRLCPLKVLALAVATFQKVEPTSLEIARHTLILINTDMNCIQLSSSIVLNLGRESFRSWLATAWARISKVRKMQARLGRKLGHFAILSDSAEFELLS